MPQWHGSLACSAGASVEDVSLEWPDLKTGHGGIPPSASLRFLSLVDITRIPSYLRYGPTLDVSTSKPETEVWFSDLLLHGAGNWDESWWQTARPESPLGLLAAVNHPVESDSSPVRATEILFLAIRSTSRSNFPPTPPRSSPGIRRVPDNRDETSSDESPRLMLKAITLSSDLLQIPTGQPTPPGSPVASDHDTTAFFLPDRFDTLSESEPPLSTKRRYVSSSSDRVAQQRKRPKKDVGPSEAAAATASSSNAIPDPTHSSRQESPFDSLGPSTKRTNDPRPQQTRPLSRASSIASLQYPPSRRPSSSHAPAPRKSGLSRSQTLPLASPAEGNTTESRNKETISRLVMAGLRLHGYTQSSKRFRDSRRSSVAPTTAGRAGLDAFDEADSQMLISEDVRAKDDEYKLLYHQIYKGVLFAFRAHVASMPLQPCTHVLGDVVDRLLAIYCTDSLAEGLKGMGMSDEFTASGRKVFGSQSLLAMGEDGETKNGSPFAERTPRGDESLVVETDHLLLSRRKDKQRNPVT